MTVAGCEVECSPAGVLRVRSGGAVLTVLPRGTHAALDVLGETAKRQIVRWWKGERP